jgi:hypothetical protein
MRRAHVRQFIATVRRNRAATIIHLTHTNFTYVYKDQPAWTVEDQENQTQEKPRF